MATTAARQFRRSRRQRIIGGVCGGIAERLGWSPWLVRLLFVVLTPLPLFPGIPLYLILWLALPLAE